MNIKDITIQARFWSKVKVPKHSNSNQCWEWQGGTTNAGYGVASAPEGKTMLAHRFVAGLSQDITDKTVMHRCDNPLCCRPDHLIVGTQQENMHDMTNKGRRNTKLDIEAVKDIRTRELSRLEYAKKYNCSHYTIGDIQRNATWTWVK